MPHGHHMARGAASDKHGSLRESCADHLGSPSSRRCCRRRRLRRRHLRIRHVLGDGVPGPHPGCAQLAARSLPATADYVGLVVPAQLGVPAGGLLRRALPPSQVGPVGGGAAGAPLDGPGPPPVAWEAAAAGSLEASTAAAGVATQAAPKAAAPLLAAVDAAAALPPPS